MNPSKMFKAVTIVFIYADTIIHNTVSATGETPVHWQKDGESIGGGSSKSPVHRRSPVERMLTEVRQMEHWVSGRIVGIKDQPENTPFVDSTGVLRVPITAPKNSGNYECSVNGTPRGSFQVEVIVKSALSFDDLIRHFAYVSLVLLSGVMVWCGVVLCVTLRRRIQKHSYSELPQTDGGHRPDKRPPPARNDHESSGSQSEGQRDSDESSVDPGGRPGKRANKQKSASHLPSRKLLRVAKADSSEPPSPLTASYHKVPSRLRDCRVRTLSRLMSHHSSANDDIELVRLMVPQSSVTHYRPRTPSGRHCRQCSSASSSSADFDASAGKGPVTILSQQLFPASQKVLRPAPLPIVRTRSPTKATRNLLEATLQKQPSSAAPSCSWSPSAISISVLRARNSLRQGVTPSPSKLARTVQLSSKTQRPKMAGTSTESNVRAGTHKKLRKSGKRRSKTNVSAKPRRPHAPASETRPKKTSKTLNKRRSFSSSPTSSRTKSPLRKKPTTSVQPKSSLRRLSSSKSVVSKRTNSQGYVSRNSPVRREPVRSLVTASPRLSLLYKAPPTPKPGPSVFNSQDRGSCISFMSNSANNSAVDPAAVPPEGEKALDDKRLSADTEALSTASVANAQQCDISSPNKLSITKGPQDSDQEITGQPQRANVVDTFCQYPAALPHCGLPLSDSQHSMFQIPEMADKQSQPQIPSLPLTARQSSTFHRVAQTQPAEHSDSLENLKLVAAFLDTSAQKKARTPRRSLLQPVSGCIPVSRSQSRPQSSSQGSFLVPPPVVIASPCQSETIFPRPSSLPTQTSNFARSNMIDSFSIPVPKDVPTNHTEYLQRMQHRPSIPKTSASNPSKQAKNSTSGSANRFPTTHVSRQLLPALLFPCAIALPDQVPIFNKFTSGTPVVQPSPILKKIVPASPVKSNTSSMKSSTSTLQSIFNPISEQQVLTASERNIVTPMNTDSALRIEGLGEDERMSLRSATLIRNTVKEVRLRPSRGRSPSKSQSKKLVAVSALEPSGCIESRADVLTTIRETKSEDVCGNSPGRYRTPRSETETSTLASFDWVPSHHKTTTKPPSSSKSLPYSGKTSAAATLRKIASARYSKHKGFYIRQKPGLEQFQIVLVDTDELAKKNETPGDEHKNGSGTTSRNKLALAGSKDKSKSPSAIFDSVTKFATPAAAVVIPQIISSNTLWQADPPLAINDVISRLQTAYSSVEDKSIRGEPQPVLSGFQPILGEPIRSEPQPILSEPQPVRIEPHPIRNEPQTVRSELQPVRSELQPIRSDPQPIRSDPQPILNDQQPVRSEHQLMQTEAQPIRSEPKPIKSEPQAVSSEPQPIRSKHKPIRSKPQQTRSEVSEFKPMRSEPQPIRNELQPATRGKSQTTPSGLQPIRSESQTTRSEPKPTRDEHRRIRSAPQYIPDNTQRTPEEVQSGASNRSIRPHSHEASRSAFSPPSRSQELRYTISKRDLIAKASKGTRSTQRVMNRSKRSSHVTMPIVTGPFEFKFKQAPKHDAFNLAETPSDRAGFQETPQTFSNQKVGSIRGSHPCYQYVKLTQSLPQACGSPSLLELMDPTTRSSKSVGVIRTSLLKVLPRPEQLLSPSKPVSSQSSTHNESRFAAELLAVEPSPATSHMTQVEKTDIVDTRKSEIKLIDSTLDLPLNLYGSTHGLHKPAKNTLRPNRNLKDESTSNGSLGETYVKSRRVRLATNEIALQVSNIDIQPKVPLKTTNSIPKRQQFTSTRKRQMSAKARSHTNITLQASPQKSYHERTSLKGRTAKTPLSPPYSSYLETPVHIPHCLPENPHVTVQSRLPTPVRKKSAHRVKTNEPRPKTPLYQTAKPTRTRTVRKPPEPSTPTRPHSSRATSNSTPTSFPKSPRVKSPFAQRSPQRKRQISPPSNVRTSKAPPLLRSNQLKSESLCEDTASKPIPEPSELLLQDYDSHHIIFHPTEPGTERCESREAEISSIDAVKVDAASEGNQRMSPGICNAFSSTLQNIPQTPICSALTTDSLKGVFDGALVNAAQGVIAISMSPYQAAEVSEPGDLTPAVKKSSAPMIMDDTSAISEVQSVAKVTSPQSRRSRSRPRSQAEPKRKSRHRKSSKQFCRSLTPVSHQLNVESNLSTGANSNNHTPEVYVFGVQEPTHSGLNVSKPSRQGFDTLALPASASNFTCGTSVVPDNSTSSTFLQDGFTTVHGISTAELTRRRTSRKKLDSE